LTDFTPDQAGVAAPDAENLETERNAPTHDRADRGIHARSISAARQNRYAPHRSKS
jgi:hypothetical protein